jgi:hypothetical protein
LVEHKTLDILNSIAMRDFVAGYCAARFGNEWYLSPALSLHVHAGATTLPKQVIVHTPLG